MIWSATVEKSGLLTLAGGPPSGYSAQIYNRLEDVRPYVGHGDYIFIWNEEPRKRGTPNMIVVSSEQQADLFSFASAYLSHLRPVTAFIRVVNDREFSELVHTERNDFPDALSEAATAVVICEAVGYLDRLFDVPLFRTAVATHSFAMARFAMQGRNAHFSDSVSGGWHIAKRLFGEQKRRFTEVELMQPWVVLQWLSRGGLPGVQDGFPGREIPFHILEVCRQMVGQTEVHLSVFPGMIPATIYQALKAGTREEKVEAFDQFVRIALESSEQTSSLTTAFALGFLCSEISRGSLEHIPLLAPVLSRFPSSLLWYGLCTGLRRQGGVLAYSQGLGRLIYRELSRQCDPLELPSCDIALKELQVLSKRNNQITEFRGASSSYVDVEIVPCVTSSFAVPTRKEQERRSPNASELELDRNMISRRIGAIVGALRSLQDEIAEQPTEAYLPFDKRKSRKPR